MRPPLRGALASVSAGLLVVSCIPFLASCNGRHVETPARESPGAQGPQAGPPRGPLPNAARATQASPSRAETRTGASGAGPVPSPHSWQRILTVDTDDPGAWFASLWVSEQQTLYVTGNRGVTRQTFDGTLQQSTPQTVDVMLDVWGVSETEVYAVGGRGSVARYDGTQWLQEREPGPKAPRSRELLHSVGPFLADRSIVAFGPAVSLRRGPNDRWSPLSASEDRYVRKRWGGLGRDPSPCQSVGVQSWFADRAGKTWVQCQDRRVYWLEDDAFVSHGSAPPECQHAFRHVFFRGALYVTCDGALFRNLASEWQREPLPEQVSYLTASDRCLFAAGRRTVLRKCVPD